MEVVVVVSETRPGDRCARLFPTPQARARASKRTNEAMEVIWRAGIIPGSWWNTIRGRKGTEASEGIDRAVNGPSCPLITRPGGRLLLPLPQPSSAQA